MSMICARQWISHPMPLRCPRSGNNWTRRAPTPNAPRRICRINPFHRRWPRAPAQQGMQELRENLKNQASNQFSQQMRDLRTEARDLASKEEKIGSTLESLANPDRKSLDDSAQRQQLVHQMSQQESALTNLLGQMQNVSEQAETSEPLLSQQLYDALRRASQMHNENLLETGEQLVDHGLVSQAGAAEGAVAKEPRMNFAKKWSAPPKACLATKPTPCASPKRNWTIFLPRSEHEGGWRRNEIPGRSSRGRKRNRSQPTGV